MPGEARSAAALSLAYMVAIAGKVLRSFPLDVLDLLLVAAIADANAARSAMPSPRKTRAARAVPPADKTGISRNAVSRMLGVPLETVRRRVAALVERKILIEQADGLVFNPDNPITLGSNAELNAFNMEMLTRLFRGLKANGIKLD